MTLPVLTRVHCLQLIFPQLCISTGRNQGDATRHTKCKSIMEWVLMRLSLSFIVSHHAVSDVDTVSGSL